MHKGPHWNMTDITLINKIKFKKRTFSVAIYAHQKQCWSLQSPLLEYWAKFLTPLSAPFFLFHLIWPCKSSNCPGEISGVFGLAAGQVFSLCSPWCCPPWQIPWGTLPQVWGQRGASKAQVFHKLVCFYQEREGGSCWSWFAFHGEERNRLCSLEVALWSFCVRGSTFWTQKQEAFCGFGACKNFPLFFCLLVLFAFFLWDCFYINSKEPSVQHLTWPLDGLWTAWA